MRIALCCLLLLTTIAGCIIEKYDPGPLKWKVGPVVIIDRYNASFTLAMWNDGNETLTYPQAGHNMIGEYYNGSGRLELAQLYPSGGMLWEENEHIAPGERREATVRVNFLEPTDEEGVYFQVTLGMRVSDSRTQYSWSYLGPCYDRDGRVVVVKDHLCDYISVEPPGPPQECVPAKADPPFDWPPCSGSRLRGTG